MTKAPPPRPHPGGETLESIRQQAEEHPLADLFYADTDLDRSMDLLAICRLD